MAFKKPPMGKRGYDEDDVDAFLDEVEQQLTRLLEENEALRGEMRAPVAGAAVSSGAVNAEFSAVGAQLARVQQERARAEQEARGLQQELERARSAVEEAPPRSGGGDAVLMMAQRTADDHMRDARQESDQVLSAARDESVRVTSEARVRASQTENDARRNHTESITKLQDQRAALLEEIERLSQLAQSYQAALSGHMTRQLQDMDGVAEVAAGRD